MESWVQSLAGPFNVGPWSREPWPPVPSQSLSSWGRSRTLPTRRASWHLQVRVDMSILWLPGGGHVCPRLKGWKGPREDSRTLGGTGMVLYGRQVLGLLLIG